MRNDETRANTVSESMKSFRKIDFFQHCCVKKCKPKKSGRLRNKKIQEHRNIARLSFAAIITLKRRTSKSARFYKVVKHPYQPSLHWKVVNNYMKNILTLLLSVLTSNYFQFNEHTSQIAGK